jgi:hypothetical protein
MEKVGINKIDKLVTIIIRILLLAAVVFETYRGRWLTLFTAVAGLVLTFLPEILQKQKGIYLPKSLQIMYTLFIYGSVGLGEQGNFYERFPWWDTLLHFTSGVILGILGFAFVYFINKERNISLKLNPFFICAFTFTFVVTMGVFWEIFEFSVDQFLGFNMQKWQGGIRAGLIDTMEDLIVDTIGAFIVTLPGYIYLKKDKKKFFKSIKEGFEGKQEEEKF